MAVNIFQFLYLIYDCFVFDVSNVIKMKNLLNTIIYTIIYI